MLLAVSFDPGVSRATFLERCEHLLLGARSTFSVRARDAFLYGVYPGSDAAGRPVLYHRGKVHFEEADLQRWIAAFSVGLMSHPVNHTAIHGDLFWEMVSRLPADVLSDLMRFPGAMSEGRALLSLLGDHVYREANRTFLSDMVDRVPRNAQTSGTLSEWFRSNLDRYAALPASTRAEFAVQAERLHRAYVADHFWSTDLPVNFAIRSREDGLGEELIVGDQKYPVLRRSSSGVVVLAPRSRLHHPAWNPVDMNHLLELARAKEPPPEEYRVDLSIDGNFQIEDGNHRFELDGRKEMPVVLVNPVRVNLRRSMAALGLSEAGAARTIEAMEQGRTPLELLDPWVTKRLLPEVRRHLETPF